eukprot:3248656-Amphidinium_carterae.4
MELRLAMPLGGRTPQDGRNLAANMLMVFQLCSFDTPAFSKDSFSVADKGIANLTYPVLAIGTFGFHGLGRLRTAT